MIKKILAKYFNVELCEKCTALQDQLDYERLQNKELIETLTSLVKPAPVIANENKEPTKVTPNLSLWSKRRSELEKQDRLQAVLLKKSPLAAEEDNVSKVEIQSSQSVEELEQELGIEQEVNLSEAQGESNASNR